MCEKCESYERQVKGMEKRLSNYSIVLGNATVKISHLLQSEKLQRKTIRLLKRQNDRFRKGEPSDNDLKTEQFSEER